MTSSEELPPPDIEVGECSEQPQQHAEFSIPPALGESDHGVVVVDEKEP